MKVAAVYGTEHKGSTYNIVRLFLDRLHVAEENLSEFFLPRGYAAFLLRMCEVYREGRRILPHIARQSLR